MPNLGAESIQQSEKSYLIIKNQTNKYIPIEVVVQKLWDNIIKIAYKHKDMING